MNKLLLVVLIAVSTLFYAQLTWTDNMRPEVCNYKGQVMNGMKHGYDVRFMMVLIMRDLGNMIKKWGR